MTRRPSDYAGRTVEWIPPEDAPSGCATATHPKSGWSRGLLALIAALALALGAWGAWLAIQTPEPVPETVVEYRTTGLALDVTNARQMHDAGLPTKADVVEWHMAGRWGWGLDVDGRRESYESSELPGGAGVWDTLYGIRPNAAFRY